MDYYVIGPNSCTIMNSGTKFVNVCSQSGESRFLSSFSQSNLEQSWEPPTSKRPKLEIAKNGNALKLTESMNKSVHNNKYIDNKQNEYDGLMDDEIDFDTLAQAVDETIAQSQMTQLTQHNVSTAVQINQKVIPNEIKIHQGSIFKSTVAGKNSPKVPLRRVSSSQWPSSSNFSSTHNLKNFEVPNNGKHLHNDFEQLRLENKRMKEELDEKTGEAKILREKVNSTIREKEKIKMEYCNKINTLKFEAEQNNNHYLKQIKSLKGQLDVKDMEIKTAERRVQISTTLNRIQPDSPNNRIRGSPWTLKKESILECEFDRSLITAMVESLPLKFVRESVTPELIESSQPEAPFSESVRTSNPRLFSGLFSSSRPDEGAGGPSTLKSDFTSRCSVAKMELRTPHTSITPCAELLLNPGFVDITCDKAHQAISQVVDKCHQILIEHLKQLETALSSNNRFIERERELLLLGFRQLPLDKDFDLISHSELYNDEKGIPARRALGLLSLLVEASDFAAEKIILSDSKESTEMLDTVRNIVRQIEKQRRTLMFEGVLAGSVVLMKNLIKANVKLPKESQTLIVDILRWVVSARPGCLVIRSILQTLLVSMRYSHIINSLCHNSGEKTFKENIRQRQRIIQFTPDSCILQVLCSLVKNAETPKKHILTDLFTLWALSLFCSGYPRPQWLTMVPTSNSCHCHSLVCKLSFSLLSEACFTYPSATKDEKKKLTKVLDRGVLLMNTFMNDDDHLLDIVKPYSLGCYLHFLHSMNNMIESAKIELNATTREILENMCNEEEALKQPGITTNAGQNAQLHTSLTLFETGESCVSSSNVLETLESM